MTAFLVGTEQGEMIAPKLQDMGVHEVVHWSGTTQLMAGCDIPKGTDFVIFCSDYLQYSAGRALRYKIKQSGLPSVYCRGSWSEIEPEVSKILGGQKHQCCGRCANCTCGDRSPLGF